MRVYINRSPVTGPWGGGNMWVKSAYEILPRLGIEIVDLGSDPDAIIIVGMGPEGQHPGAVDLIRYKERLRSVGRKVDVIFRVNENDARKGTTGVDDAVRSISSHSDVVIFVSEWLRGYFHLSHSSTFVVQNGVDDSVFRPGRSMENGKINLVTHHWSDNYMKGFDVYEALDAWLSDHPDYTFTYIGRHRGTFRNSKILGPLWGKELGEELSRYDVYISASRFDPGPNHIIESLACDIPTYVHADGGGCVEFAGMDHVYRSIPALLNILDERSYTKNRSWFPGNWEKSMTNLASILRSRS